MRKFRNGINRWQIFISLTVVPFIFALALTVLEMLKYLIFFTSNSRSRSGVHFFAINQWQMSNSTNVAHIFCTNSYRFRFVNKKMYLQM